MFYRIEDCPDLIIDHGKFELLGEIQNYKPGLFIPNFAILKFTCDINYELHPNDSLVTCLDGNFKNAIPKCKRILKGAVDDVINVIDECGYWDEHPPCPWNVAIYQKEGNNYIFRCAGSIVTSTIIITSINCITQGTDNKTKPSVEEFYVAAGKYYNDYNAEEDVFAQISQVKEYHIPPVTKERNYILQSIIEVIVLKTPFNMTNVVQPVCLDRNNKIESRQVTPNNKGIIIGWTANASYRSDFEEELKQANSSYIGNKQCYFRRGNRGGSIAYKWHTNNKQQFYIRGVNTFMYTDFLSGGQYSVGIFANITFYKEFILKIIDQQLRADSCPSITIENGQFHVLGQDYTPNDFILNDNLVKLTCNDNYTLHPANPLIACSNGDWSAPIPQCKLTCPPVISNSADVRCTVDGITVDCSEPLVEGAVAKSKCKPFYTQSGNDVPISTCVRGTWSNRLVRCVPECGEAISNGITHVVNGTNTKKGEFPWHVALYRLVRDKQEYQCGGSIINPLIIITAAHCFTDERGVGYPVEEFYIGAGKYYSDYNSIEDTFVQKRHVREYNIPSQFRGFDSNYAGDLAVVIVWKAFQITSLVQPVCLDWDGKMESQQLKHNNVGSVVGWGYLDPTIPKTSAELKKLNPPFIDLDKCLKEVPSTFLRWVTPDKFCAGFLTGSSICKGDSGGGLVFKWNNNGDKYFLRGLVSVGPVRKGSCDNFQYGVYTRISFYNNFILDIIAANEVKD